MPNDRFNELEAGVMKMLLAGDDPVLQVLREQYCLAEVTSREFTGVGFYSHYAIPADAPRISGSPSFPFGDVEASIEGTEAGAGFLLWVREGAIDYLEGYTYSDDWPASIGKFGLTYIGGLRNINELRQAWEAKLKES